MSIRDVIRRLCFDTDTISLQMFGGIGWIRLESHKNWQNSITIYKYVLGNTARHLGMNHKTVKIRRQHVRIMYE